MGVRARVATASHGSLLPGGFAPHCAVCSRHRWRRGLHQELIDMQFQLFDESGGLWSMRMRLKHHRPSVSSR